MFYDILPRTPNEDKQDFNQQYIRTVRKSLFFYIGSLSTEDHHSNKFRLATMHVYHALLNKVKLPWQNYQYLVGVSSNGLYEFKHLGRGGWGGGGVLIQSEGKYELEWLKQFNADEDERFI